MLVREIAEEIGFTQVSLSSVIMPMCRAVPRGHTACVDAYLTPSIKRYVDGKFSVTSPQHIYITSETVSNIEGFVMNRQLSKL